MSVAELCELDADIVEAMRARFLTELRTHVAVRRALIATWTPAPLGPRR